MSSCYARVAQFLFICLFPLFFFYHLLIAAGFIPPFLGGGIAIFGVAGLGFAVISFTSWLPGILSGDRFTSVLWLAFLLICLGYTAYFLVVAPSDYLQSAATQSLQAFVLIMALFFVGYFLDISSRWFFYVLLVAGLSMFLFLVAFSITSGKLMFYAKLFFDQGDEVATYQGFARSALLTFVPLISMARSGYSRATLIVIGTYVIFVLGARSEFFSFALWLGLFFIITMIRSRGLFVVALLGLILMLATLGSVWEQINDSRQLEVVNLSASTSWVAREELFGSTLKIVEMSPLLGDFGGHIREGGHAGAYSHNALSAWVSYGGFGFVFYILSLFTAFFMATLMLLRSQPGLGSQRLNFAFAMSFIVFLLVLVAKPVFWPLTGLAMGYYLRSVQVISDPAIGCLPAISRS